MTKKEAIEAIERTRWCGVAPETDLFEKLHKIAQEYKESTGDNILDDIFTDYLSESEATEYVEEALKANGFSRVCAIVHCVHHLNAGVYVRDMYGNLRDYDHKDTLYIRSEILHRLSDPSVEDEYIEKVKNIDRTKPCNEIYRELQNLARMYNDETGYRGFKYLFEHDAALQLIMTSDPDKKDTEINTKAVINELERLKNDKRRID